MSSLKSTPGIHGVSVTCLAKVIILEILSVAFVWWLHSRYVFFFLQWSVTTTLPRSNGTTFPVLSLYLSGCPGIGVVLGGSTVCGRRREPPFLCLFLPPVLFAARELGHRIPSSIISKANTGTGNVALGGRLTRTVLYDFRVENPRSDFNNGLMITCDKPLTHNVALWSTSFISKLNPFFIPFCCFMASNALTILFEDA